MKSVFFRNAHRRFQIKLYWDFIHEIPGGMVLETPFGISSEIPSCLKKISKYSSTKQSMGFLRNFIKKFSNNSLKTSEIWISLKNFPNVFFKKSFNYSFRKSPQIASEIPPKTSNVMFLQKIFHKILLKLSQDFL